MPHKIQKETEHFWDHEIRPRFKLSSPKSLDQIIFQINTELKKETASCQGRILHDHVTLFIPHEDQHYWSPQLSLTIEENENGSLIQGLYGPRPAVWTLFVFFYAFIAFLILMVAILGFSYISLGDSAAILWLLPVLILIFLSLYRTSYVGQKLGKDQMKQLDDFLKKCLNN